MGIDVVMGGTSPSTGSGRRTAAEPPRENGPAPTDATSTTADDAGFAAVRVDDIGSVRADEAREGDQGPEVGERLDGADEIGNDGEQTREGVDEGFEGAFGAGGGAADEPDGEIGFEAETQDGRDGVFLGAADDQSRDDMEDAHEPGAREGRRVGVSVRFCRRRGP